MTMLTDDFVDNAAALPVQVTCWYQPSHGGRYWHPDSKGQPVFKNRSQFQQWLITRGMLDYIPEDEKGERRLSEIAEFLVDLETERVLDYAGPVAGHKAGTLEWNRQKMLVTRPTVLIDPLQPEGAEKATGIYDFSAYGFPVLGAVLEGMMNGVEVDEDGTERYEQLPMLFTWCWHFLKSLYSSQYSTGLALGLAGEPNSGKTLLAKVIKEITGGTVAKPYESMTGKDNFNEEWLGATLLLIDDENSDTQIQQRLRLGAEIKKVVAAQEGVRIRGMHQTAMLVPSIQRLLIAVNLEPERLQVLPPIDGDIRDKLLILKAYSKPFPMRSETLEERKEFWAAIESELPYFVWYLTKVWDPKRDQLGRFGAVAWQHPQVLEELLKLSPEARTHEFIDRFLNKCQPHISEHTLPKMATAVRALIAPLLANGPIRGWCGTASELRADLVADGDSAPLATSERREVRQSTYLGRDLDALSRRHPRQIFSTRQPGTGARNWVILSQPMEDR